MAKFKLKSEFKAAISKEKSIQLNKNDLVITQDGKLYVNEEGTWIETTVEEDFVLLNNGIFDKVDDRTLDFIC